MQNLIDVFLSVIKKLESENIPYMVAEIALDEIYMQHWLGELALQREFDKL